MRRSLLVLVSCLSLAVARTAAATPTAGLEGPTFGAAVVSKGLEATGQKPESKLFYTQDGRWWAALGLADGVTPGVYLLELTETGWIERALLAESDPWSKADTLYDPSTSTLLVSLRDNKLSTETNPRRSTLHTLTYDGNGGWSEPGAPLTITTAGVETITIARDSLGRVWAAFEQGKRVKAGYLPVGGSTFTFLLVSATNVAGDDIASVVAFGPPDARRIGVLWSDQIADAFVFASRADTARLRASSFTRETAYGAGTGGCPTETSILCADDHVNVTAVGDGVVAAVKTSLNDAAPADPGDPLVVLLSRSGGGAWTSTEVCDVAANYTRPIVFADPGADQVHVFASILGIGGDTYVWHASLTSPSFADPQPWTVDDALTLGNPTSTKQTVSSATGYVVVTSTPKAPYRYWYDVVAGT